MKGDERSDEEEEEESQDEAQKHNHTHYDSNGRLANGHWLQTGRVDSGDISGRRLSFMSILGTKTFKNRLKTLRGFYFQSFMFFRKG